MTRQKLYFIAGMILIFFSCSKKEGYHSEFAGKWGDVENFVHTNWHTSLVNSKAFPDLQKKGIVPPKPFMSIAKGDPTLFYWDNYFTNKGLLKIDSLSHYALNVTDNLLWEVDTLGFVPNANMNWGMNRSQIPFLAPMVFDVYRKLGDKSWLQKAYFTLKKEYHFWTDTSSTAIENHTTSVPGLQRFYHHGTSEDLIDFYTLCYRRGLLAEPPDSVDYQTKLTVGGNYMAEAEVMDFTPRFENRCTDFVAVDLNCNLYVYEMLFEWMVKELNLTGEPDWKAMAEKRKDLINKYCWDEERGLFMDYDFKNQRFSKIASIACIYPLYVGLASQKQAEKTRANLALFEYQFGVTVCEKVEKPILYQWDYPAGWPPVYLLTIQALQNYGYKTDALRICEKYLDVVTRNFISPQPLFRGNNQKQKRSTGFIYEKYDVVTGGINDWEYPAWEFLGWSAGVYIWCLDYYRNNKK
jgi:alpha,alpha-trehalase